MESNIKIETKVTLKIKDVKVSLTIEEARQLVQDLGQVVGKEYCTRQHYYTPYYPNFYTASGSSITVPLTTTSNNTITVEDGTSNIFSLEKAE